MGSLSLFAWRASTLRNGGIFAPISREGSLILNNLLLTVACAGVLVGDHYIHSLWSLLQDRRYLLALHSLIWCFGALMVAVVNCASLWPVSGLETRGP